MSPRAQGIPPDYLLGLFGEVCSSKPSVSTFFFITVKVETVVFIKQRYLRTCKL